MSTYYQNQKALDEIAFVKDRLSNIIGNLNDGKFGIVILDDGAPRDVTKDNVCNLTLLINRLERANNYLE